MFQFLLLLDGDQIGAPYLSTLHTNALYVTVIVSLEHFEPLPDIFVMTLHRFCNLSVVISTCSMELSRLSQTTPSSFDFYLSGIGILQDNSLFQIVKIVDDDSSTRCCKFVLATQLCSSSMYSAIWHLS